MEPDFSKVEADVLIIGVPEHPENTDRMGRIRHFFQSTFTGMG